MPHDQEAHVALDSDRLDLSPLTSHRRPEFLESHRTIQLPCTLQHGHVVVRPSTRHDQRGYKKTTSLGREEPTTLVHYSRSVTWKMNEAEAQDAGKDPRTKRSCRSVSLQQQRGWRPPGTIEPRRATTQHLHGPIDQNRRRAAWPVVHARRKQQGSAPDLGKVSVTRGCERLPAKLRKGPGRGSPEQAVVDRPPKNSVVRGSLAIVRRSGVPFGQPGSHLGREIDHADAMGFAVRDVEPTRTVDKDAVRPRQRARARIALRPVPSPPCPEHGRDDTRCQLDTANNVVLGVGHIETAAASRKPFGPRQARRPRRGAVSGIA